MGDEAEILLSDYFQTDAPVEPSVENPQLGWTTSPSSILLSPKPQGGKKSNLSSKPRETTE